MKNHTSLIWSKTLEDKSKKSIEKCELNRQNYHDKTNKQAKQRELLGWFGYGPFDLTRPAGSLCSHPRDTSGTKGSSEGQQNRTQRLPNARLSHLGDVTWEARWIVGSKAFCPKAPRPTAEVQCSKIAERSARPTCSPQNFDHDFKG